MLIINGKKHSFTTKKLLVSEQSLNFDFIVQSGKMTFETMKSLRVKAFLMELKLAKIIMDWNLPKRRDDFTEI